MKKLVVLLLVGVLLLGSVFAVSAFPENPTTDIEAFSEDSGINVLPLSGEGGGSGGGGAPG